MPFLVGVVGVTDSSGSRVDTPDENGDHSPLILQLGASMIGTKSTTEGGLTKVIVESAAAGSSAPGVVSLAALKALAHASLTDKQTRPTFDVNIGWRYDAAALAGVTSSDILSAKPDDLSAGTAGRHIRLSDMPTVETFADLSKLVEDTHSRVHLKEYYAGCGFGGGIFRRRTSTAPNSDTGTIVKISTNVWWEREYHGPIKSEFFGMLGDAVAVTDAVVNTASPGVVSAAYYHCTQAHVGNGLIVQTPNAPATGTYATNSAVNASGTWTTVANSCTLAGDGSTNSAEFFVGMIIGIGATNKARVTRINSTHSIDTNWDGWGAAAGQTVKRWWIAGTTSDVATDLVPGRPCVIGGNRYNIVAIDAAGQRASVYPVPGATAGATTLYKNTALAGKISVVTDARHVTLASMTHPIAVNGTGLSATYGTDNSAAYIAARAAAAAKRRRFEIASADSHYLIFDDVPAMGDSVRGLTIAGHGFTSLTANPPGHPDYLRVDTPTGTVLHFLRGNGLTQDSTLFVNSKVRDIAIIGSGIDSCQGFGQDVTGTHAADGGQGANVHEDLLIANWAIGHNVQLAIFDKYNNFSFKGCAVAVQYRGAFNNLQTWNELDTGQCGIGFWVQTVFWASVVNATIQGSLVWGTLLEQAVQSILFLRCWWENNTRAGGGAGNGECGNALLFKTGAGAPIQQITFTKCTINDAYVLDPDVSGSGSINAIITDEGNFFGCSVRPRWTNWRPGGSWHFIEWSFSLGGVSSSQNSGVFGFANWPTRTLRFVSGGVTPSTGEGEYFDYAPTANTTFHVPSPTPPVGAIFSMLVRPQSGGPWAISWDAGYQLNPWVNSLSTSADVSFIQWTHMGGDIYFCSNHQPFTVARPTYTVANHTLDRALDETGDTLGQVANVVGSLIKDLQTKGILQ